MSRQDKVLKNSAVLAAQHIFINLVSIFVVGFIARKLGKGDYGVYSLAFAFPAIFEFVGSLGLRPLTIREISLDKEGARDFIGKVVPARAMLITLMASMVMASALALGYDKVIISALLITLGSSVCEQFSRIILDVFQAHEEMGKVAFRDVTVRIFTACASVLVLLLGYGLYAVCFVYLLGSLLGLLINLYLYTRRFEIPRFVLDSGFIVTNLKEGRSYVLGGMVAALYPKIDVLLLSKLVDGASLGSYTASSTLLYRLNFVADAIATAVFPALSQLYWTRRDEACAIFNRCVFMVTLVSLPVAIGGYLLSADIISLIYGETYRESARIFSILILSVPFLFVSTLFNYSLGAIKQQGFVARSLVANLALGVVLNAVMIRQFGNVGAALATVATQCTGSLFLLYGVVRFFPLRTEWRSLATLTVSVSLLTLSVLGTMSYGIYLALPVAFVVYYLSLRLTGFKFRMSFS